MESHEPLPVVGETAAITGAPQEYASMMKLQRIPLAFPKWPSPFKNYDYTKPYFHIVDSFHYGRPAGSTGVNSASEHHAQDLMCPRGTPVVAAAPGVVVANYWDHFGGWACEVMSELTSGRRVKAYYAHMAVPAFWPMGTPVNTGDMLGLVGNTGGTRDSRVWERGAGPTHLHLALYHETSPNSGNFSVMLNPYHQIISMTSQMYPPNMAGRIPPNPGMPEIKPGTAPEDLRTFTDQPSYLEQLTPVAIRRWTEAIVALSRVGTGSIS